MQTVTLHKNEYAASPKEVVKKIIIGDRDRRLPILWIQRREGSQLPTLQQGDYIKPALSPFSKNIEVIARETNTVGSQPVWQGYEGNNTRGSTRMPEGVRTTAPMGDLYTWLVQIWKPETIVEFGTAFGVSEMYSLAGLEGNRKGHLLTFEPIDVWRKLAIDCLDAISKRYTGVAGTFEESH